MTVTRRYELKLLACKALVGNVKRSADVPVAYGLNTTAIDFNRNGPHEKANRNDKMVIALDTKHNTDQTLQGPGFDPDHFPDRQVRARFSADLGLRNLANSGQFAFIDWCGDLSGTKYGHHTRGDHNRESRMNIKPAEDVAGKQRKRQRFYAVRPLPLGNIGWEKRFISFRFQLRGYIFLKPGLHLQRIPMVTHPDLQPAYDKFFPTAKSVRTFLGDFSILASDTLLSSYFTDCHRIRGLLAGGCLCGLPRSRTDVLLAPEYGLTIQIPLASASSIHSNLKFAVYCRYGAAAAIHPIRNFRKAHFAFA